MRFDSNYLAIFAAAENFDIVGGPACDPPAA